MSNTSLSDEKKMKKVLMIARTFPPFRSVGHSIRVVKFIKYLPTLGWLPVVLTVDDQKEYETMPKLGSESLLSDIQPQINIYRAAVNEPSLSYLEKEKEFGQKNWFTSGIVKFLGGGRRWLFRNIFLPDRHLAWLPSALSVGRKIVNNEGIDVIFATCPPHSVSLIGALLKQLTGKPLILDYRDDWIDTPWFQSLPTIRRWIERKMERWVVKNADKVILVTEWSKNAFLERYPREPNNKFIFISNGCDLEEFTDVNPPSTRKNNSKFTILHAGSLNDSKSWPRTPVSLFQAIHNILQENPDLSEKLSLAFTGFLPDRLKQTVKELDLSDVVKELGFLQRDVWVRCMKQSDLLLVINYEGFSTLIPGKIYEYWAVGGPPILLLSCIGAASTLVKEYNLGLTVDPSDVAGIEQAILTVYHQSMSDLPMRINTNGVEAYGRQALTRKLSQVLSTVT